jgi:hypothetical protein
MVEAPGTAPGSEWFIPTAIYRHSRQAGATNIGGEEQRRKSGRAVLRRAMRPRPWHSTCRCAPSYAGLQLRWPRVAPCRAHKAPDETFYRVVQPLCSRMPDGPPPGASLTSLGAGLLRGSPRAGAVRLFAHSRRFRAYLCFHAGTLRYYKYAFGADLPCARQRPEHKVVTSHGCGQFTP